MMKVATAAILLTLCLFTYQAVEGREVHFKVTCPGVKGETGVTAMTKGGHKGGSYAMIACCAKGPGTPKTPKRNRVNFDKARANMDLDGLTEIVQKMVTFHFEKDEAKKEELTKELFSSYLPNQLGYYEKILKLYQASRIKNLQRG